MSFNTVMYCRTTAVLFRANTNLRTVTNGLLTVPHKYATNS